MGRVRRFLRRLKPSAADSKSTNTTASASPESASNQPTTASPCNTTGSNSNRDDQPVNGLSSRVIDASSAAAENDVSKEIWINAYTKLQNDKGTCNLVKVFEEVLRQNWQEFGGKITKSQPPKDHIRTLTTLI